MANFGTIFFNDYYMASLLNYVPCSRKQYNNARIYI